MKMRLINGNVRHPQPLHAGTHGRVKSRKYHSSGHCQLPVHLPVLRICIPASVSDLKYVYGAALGPVMIKEHGDIWLYVDCTSLCGTSCQNGCGNKHFIAIIDNSLLRSHRQQNHHPAHIVAAISWHAYPYIVQSSRCLKVDRHSSRIAQEEQNKMLMILSIFLYHLYFR